MAAMGLLWIGQGLGYVRWPASSFMIDQSPWITRGAVLAVAGLVVVISGGACAADQPAGSVKTNRAPCPAALSTTISPPIARASRREM